jgi:hypothetical protein
MSEFRVGINLWSQSGTWAELLDAAKTVDRLGCEHLWTWDHVKAIVDDPQQPILEGWTTITAWAMAQSRARVEAVAKGRSGSVGESVPNGAGVICPPSM